MKTFATTAALLLTAAFAHAEELAERDLCSEGSQDVGGNWYCQLVHAVTYTGIGHTGKYLPVIGMDKTTGQCTQNMTGQDYKGNLAPFDEEVSLHFRGPLQLKQFAVYTPGSAKSTRDIEEREAEVPAHAHAHAHAHVHAHKEREAAVGDWVTATMFGKTVSWINTYSGETPAAEVHNLAAVSPAAAVQTTAAPIIAAVQSAAAAVLPSAASSGSSTGTYGSSSSSNGWARQGYYSSKDGISQGLTFLNHNGGSGSGTFDFNFGNSLSYASADGQHGASSSQILSDITIPSIAEVVIMSDKPCGDNDCGFVRPDSVAYHGFDGAEKVFLIEFAMPLTGEQSDSIYTPKDMPAVWMLNAKIPRTLQYGPSTCSCWSSGCGEFDIFEVLAPGDLRCKSTIHGNARGGDSDYFDRPTGAPIKAAVVMSNNQFHIKILDSSTTFDPSLDSSFIDGIVSSTSTQAGLVSLFALNS